MLSKRVVILDSSNSSILNASFKDVDKLNLVKLKHPKSNELNQFFLTEFNSEYDLFELIDYHVELGSLFIDNYVQSDCFIYMASRFNFDYFLLSMLYNQTNDSFTGLNDLKLKFLDLNSIDKESTQADIFLNKLNINHDSTHFEKLFDIEEKSELRLKYNQTKCIKWLTLKFDALRTYLELNAKTAPKQKVKSELEVEEKLKYEAFELIAQYLDKTLAEKLKKELNLTNPLDDNGNKKDIKRSKPQETVTL